MKFRKSCLRRVKRRLEKRRGGGCDENRLIQVVSAAGLAQMKRLAARDQDWMDLKKLGYDDAGPTDRQDAE